MSRRGHCIRCKRELAGADDREREELVRVAIAEHIGIEVISEAVDRALLASARTRTKPTRTSIKRIAGAYLAGLIDRELDRRLRQLAEKERAA